MPTSPSRLDEADRGPASAGSDLDGLDDPVLTALGLLVETSSGLLAAVAPELESFGFSTSAFEVVLRLARSPGHRQRMSELTAQCALTSSGLTRLVDRLERVGLVRREPCPSDRRGFYAVVTVEGLEQLSKALPAHQATIRRCYTDLLEPEELEVLLGALRKVRSVVSPGSDPAMTMIGTP